jgi:hypothetical protein
MILTVHLNHEQKKLNYKAHLNYRWAFILGETKIT